MHLPYGNNLKLYIEGTSHGEKLEMILDNFPAGVSVDLSLINSMLERRRPGRSPLTTARNEADKPIFLSGIENGVTTGGRIHATIRNENADSSSYTNNNDVPRPSHADYPAVIKFGKDTDLRGGGRFSGRLTAPMCIAGGICMSLLKEKNIEIFAHIYSVGSISDTPFDKVNPVRCACSAFPAINLSAAERMKSEISTARESGDSLGGVIECAATGLPVGLGEHLFAGAEGRIASILYSIPGVKGVDFGAGFASAQARGSDNNDPFAFDENGNVITATNNCGGILGGMTDGMPLIFRTAFKPVPSIAREQQSISLSEKKAVRLTVGGRHDSCIVPRAVPVVEAAAAIALCDMLLDGTPLQQARNSIDALDREIAALLCRRMDICKEIAFEKKRTGTAVSDPAREEEILSRVTSQSAEYSPALRDIYKGIFASSKALQNNTLGRKKVYLIGRHLKHSLSVPLHAVFGTYGYELKELEPNEVKDFILAKQYDALNVTVPYKQAVYKYMDYLSPEAKETGCVNTVVCKGDKLYGYNTDVEGFTRMTADAGIDASGKKVLVLGSGGAAKAVVYALRAMGAGEVITISRTGKDNYKNLEKHSDADIIVNATPVGMYPDVDASPVKLNTFTNLCGVIDLIYNPHCTDLLLEAMESGIPCTDGLPMLVYQGAAASEIFTGIPIDESTRQKALYELMRSGRNIVLTGMPGSGKTTVGMSVAEKTGRQFVDTDKEISLITGMQPSEIITRFGEEMFREIEKTVIARFAKESGLVISTGGGCVEVKENLTALKRNSVVVCLERDTALLATEGRPLSENGGVEALLERRKPLYEKCASFVCRNNSTPDAAAENIISFISSEKMK